MTETDRIIIDRSIKFIEVKTKERPKKDQKINVCCDNPFNKRCCVSENGVYYYCDQCGKTIKDQ